MAVKVTKRQTNDGPRYSISGLTFGQLFRIKNAMFEEERRMKAIADEMAKEGELVMAKDFKEFAEDAHIVAVATREGCF